MEENENVNEAESDEEYIVGKDRKMTMEERMAMGLCVVTQEETRIAIKVCYVMEYGEPNEGDWPSIITELSKRFGVRPTVVKKVFIACRNGSANLEKQKKGAGQKHKLNSDNAGPNRRSSSTEWICITEHGNRNMQCHESSQFPQ
jgi:hypothetical protein